MWHVDTISTLSIILQWSSTEQSLQKLFPTGLSRARSKASHHVGTGQTELPRVFSVSRRSSLSRRMRSLRSLAKALQGPHCGWLACTAARTIGNWPIRAQEQIHQPITQDFTCSAQISAALRPHAAFSPRTAPPPGFATFRDTETKNIFCKSFQLETQSSIESSPLSRTL